MNKIEYSQDLLNPSELCIDNIFIEPEERGKGKGKELIQEAIQFAKDNNYKTIGLYAEPQDLITDKEKLINWYLSQGFEQDPNDDQLLTYYL